KRGFPLESNPEAMNTYIAKTGWSITSYRFTDVCSTENWALAMVPQPVFGCCCDALPNQRVVGKAQGERGREV
ncbi:unnamed protein product, partial [Ascophyllum nodosum]